MKMISAFFRHWFSIPQRISTPPAIFSCHVALWLFSALLVWDPNRETDLAGYKVYVGEQSRRYDVTYHVGLQSFFPLSTLSPGKTYFLAVTAYDLSGNESDFSQEIRVEIPAAGDLPSLPKTAAEPSLALVYNFPNPFDADTQSTTLRYFLSEAQEVSIRIFDVKGDLIVEPLSRQRKGSGEHLEDRWDGGNTRGEKVATGLYYCEITTPEQTVIFPIALLRH